MFFTIAEKHVFHTFYISGECLKKKAMEWAKDSAKFSKEPVTNIVRGSNFLQAI